MSKHDLYSDFGHAGGATWVWRNGRLEVNTGGRAHHEVWGKGVYAFWRGRNDGQACVTTILPPDALADKHQQPPEALVEALQNEFCATDIRTFDNPPLAERYWVSPRGALQPLNDIHSVEARMRGFENQYDAMAAGWIRVNMQGMGMYVTVVNLPKRMKAIQKALTPLYEDIGNRPLTIEDQRDEHGEVFDIDLATLTLGSLEDIREKAREAANNPRRRRENMGWLSEFGPEFKVPKLIRDMVASGEIKDISWHNDTAPSFGKEVGKLRIRLWVEHPSIDIRELGGTRYGVFVENISDGAINEDDSVYTDDVREAVAAYRRLVREYTEGRR